MYQIYLDKVVKAPTKIHSDLIKVVTDASLKPVNQKAGTPSCAQVITASSQAEHRLGPQENPAVSVTTDTGGVDKRQNNCTDDRCA